MTNVIWKMENGTSSKSLPACLFIQPHDRAFGVVDIQVVDFPVEQPLGVADSEHVERIQILAADRGEDVERDVQLGSKILLADQYLLALILERQARAPVIVKMNSINARRQRRLRLVELRHQLFVYRYPATVYFFRALAAVLGQPADQGRPRLSPPVRTVAEHHSIVI